MSADVHEEVASSSVEPPKSINDDESGALQMDDVADINISSDDAASTDRTQIDWQTELELVISSPSANYSDIKRIASNRAFPSHLRPKVWQILLGIASRPDPFTDFDELYNLPEQSAIRTACQKLAGSLGNPESDHVIVTSDLESVLTYFCKCGQLKFTSTNGWTNILQILLVLGLPRADLYNMFYAFTTKYIATGCTRDGKPFDLFRLLLLYHDPQLCSFLDTKKISPELYATDWFTSLFATSTGLDVVLRIWDVYLQQADPFLVFFMALVMLLNAKDAIMGMKTESIEQITEQIKSIPGQLEADDIEDFCQLASYYSTRTPQSFRRDYHGPLFGSNLAAEDFANVTVHSLLCLPVSVPELLQSMKSLHRDSDDQVHYFVVDARPMTQYMNGHLPGAFNLDASLLVTSPNDYATSVESLLAYKKRTQPNAHWCFMGSGRDDEDQYVHMVVSAWLQKTFQYISVARGGYHGLHETLKESLSTRLKSHNVKGCVVCRQHSLNQSPNKLSPRQQQQLGSPEKQFNGEEALVSMIDRLSGAFKTKSTSVKDKLFDWATNPNAPDEVKHVNAGDRHGGRRYRMASAFSIADDEDDQDDEEGDGDVVDGAGAECSSSSAQQVPTPQKQLVQIDKWLKEMHVDETFDCELLSDKNKALYPGRVALTSGHLYILVYTGNGDQECVVHAKRPLQGIFKITSRKKLPELLTLKSGYDLGTGEHKVHHVDRLLSGKAGDIAKALKTAIITLHEMDRQLS